MPLTTDDEEVTAAGVEGYVAVLKGSLKRTNLLLQLQVSLGSRPAAGGGYSSCSIRRLGAALPLATHPAVLRAQGQRHVEPAARPAWYNIHGQRRSRPLTPICFQNPSRLKMKELEKGRELEKERALPLA